MEKHGVLLFNRDSQSRSGITQPFLRPGDTPFHVTNFPRSKIVLLRRTPKLQMARKTEWTPRSRGWSSSAIFPEFGSNAAPQTSPLSLSLRSPHIEYFNFSQISFLRCPLCSLPRRKGEGRGSHRGRLPPSPKVRHPVVGRQTASSAKRRLHLMAWHSLLAFQAEASEGVRNIVGGSRERKNKSERMMTFSKLATVRTREKGEAKGGEAVPGAMDCAAYPPQQNKSEILSPFISPDIATHNTDLIMSRT